MTSWSSVVIRVLFEFVKIEVLFIASTRLFFIAKQRSTTNPKGGGGGHLSPPPHRFSKWLHAKAQALACKQLWVS